MWYFPRETQPNRLCPEINSRTKEIKNTMRSLALLIESGLEPRELELVLCTFSAVQ